MSTFFTINEDNIDEDEQSFAIVAEILDVSEDIICFQIYPVDISCLGTHGTRGATEIRIADNDREFTYTFVDSFKFYNWALVIIAGFIPLSLSAMVIGFTQRIRTVCEDEAVPGEDFIPIEIGVATLRTAEREHPMVFRLQSGGTAIVEPGGSPRNPLLDAVFGTRDPFDDDAPIQEEFDLERLVAVIPPQLVDIIDDLRPEYEECFTIRIFPIDVPGRRELFYCNEDEDGATNFFCETTICICDDDGRLMMQYISLL